MKTDIEYLELLERDLTDAAARERALAVPQQPARRHWSSWEWAAAAIPVLVVAGLVGWIATGGGLTTSDQVSRDEAAGGGVAPQATMAPGGEQPGLAAPGLGEDQAGGGGGVPVIAGPQDELSKIVRDGRIALVVPDGDFDRVFAAVTRVAGNNGGFVLSSATRDERAGTLTLRIPARRFDEAMLALRELGDVERQEIRGEDVTAEFVDLRARLRIAKARRAVLLGLLGDAVTIAETLQLSGHLDDVQLRIEQIQGQLRFINDQVAEATVRVELRERGEPRDRPPGDVEHPSLTTAFDRAVSGFLVVVAAVVVGLGYLIPIAAIAGAVWLGVRFSRRGRAA